MNIYDILATVWLFIGAGLANAAPVFANKIPYLKEWVTPLDFGLEFRGKPVFGKNKTWRGLMFGALIATLTVILQKLLLKYLDTDIDINGQSFNELPTLLLGLALGIGPLVGDAIESFFKRRANVAPGKSWFPFDQLDYIIGAIIFTYPIAPLLLWQYVSLFIIGFGTHLIASYIGYIMKLKDSPI